MNITYDGRDLTLDIEAITTKQAIVIQGYSGFTLMPLLNGVREGDPRAITAIAWLAYTQSGDTLAIAELDIAVFRFLEAFNTASQAAKAAEPPDPQPAGAEAGPPSTSTPALSAASS